MSSFWKSTLLIPKCTTPKLDQLKAALDKKHPELVNRKYIIFHQDNTRAYVYLMIGKAAASWLGSSDSSAVFTRHCIFGLAFN